ncbi:MAG: glycoside hydrolase family 31 protein [Clostridium sp.]
MKIYRVNENVIRYEIGNPLDTEAVIQRGTQEIEKSLPFFSFEINEEIKLSLDLMKDDAIYGLGENIRGINKRGWVYESFCSDDPNHSPDKKSLYGAHNFFIVDGSEMFGVYIDFPSRVVFDCGFTHKDKLDITINGIDADVYIIKGDSLREITKSFLTIIGQAYVPPKWAFGYMQSRWSYPTGEAVENIANEFVKREIPCDGICLDLDYMEDFKDFSLSDERFPNFKELTHRLKEKGVKIIPIIDAGVKIEKDYDIYEEGIEGNYFTLDKEGKPFVGAVWPGKVHFPDFLNKDARLWFGKKYKCLTDLGVEGFWNDMNEPAIFYSEDGIKKALNTIDDLRTKELNIHNFFKLKDSVNWLSNSMDDYKAMYHKTENGIKNHYDVHNMYGMNMTRSAAEGLDTIEENKRFLLFSRASAIGAHRYGGIWTGDNCSWWEHLIMNMKMLPSINMCGFIYSGADTCGFGSNVDSQLAIRWNQLSIFAPLYRNHAAMGTRNQEPFAFDKETENIVKNTIQFRYAMIPYLYSEYMKAIVDTDVLIAPLCFEYKDKHVKQVEDQLLIGDSIMIAPVYEQNKKGRYVYLPEEMLLWKVKDYKSINLEVMEKGHNYVSVDMDEFCLFIRKNKMFVLGESAQSTEKLKNETLKIVAFVEDKAEYNLYDDDGQTKEYLKGQHNNINIVITLKDGKHNIKVKNIGNKEVKTLEFIIITKEGKEIVDTVKL